MKKILFFGAAAALMLTSCSNDETVDMPKGNAIQFANAFVNSSTRGEDITTANIEDFAVYGYMENVAGVIFNNEKVSKGGSAWTYANTQYWTADKNYWFAAVAPFGAAEFTADALPATGRFGTIKYDNSKQLDLLYANAKQTGVASGNTAVPFTFGHLLARTQFTFTNSATNDNVKFVVSDVKVSGTPKNGVINLGDANAAWVAEGTETHELAYTIDGTEIARGGKLASAKQYMLPISGTYTVTFNVDVYQGDVKVNDAPVAKTVTIPASQAFAEGSSYNFGIALTFNNVITDAEPIEFTVTAVDDWAAFGDYNLAF